MPLIDVYLGLGSNIGRERHIVAALDALAETFGEMDCSPVFESEPVGIRSGCFFNLVVHVRTGLALPDLVRQLKAIEEQAGRLRAGPRELPLDIDVLLYGEQTGEFDGVVLPRPRILESAHVLWPLAILAPQLRHPGSCACYAELWRAASSTHALWPVALSWQGRVLTPPWMLGQAGNMSRPAAALPG